MEPNSAPESVLGRLIWIERHDADAKEDTNHA